MRTAAKDPREYLEHCLLCLNGLLKNSAGAAHVRKLGTCMTCAYTVEFEPSIIVSLVVTRYFGAGSSSWDEDELMDLLAGPGTIKRIATDEELRAQLDTIVRLTPSPDLRSGCGPKGGAYMTELHPAHALLLERGLMVMKARPFAPTRSPDEWEDGLPKKE